MRARFLRDFPVPLPVRCRVGGKRELEVAITFRFALMMRETHHDSKQKERVDPTY
jgi:hypothetical protein